jgi:isoleucyl-tRNA synthetase
MLETYSRPELANYLKVSWVEHFVGEPEVRFDRSPYYECIRSRVRRPDVESIEVDGESVFLSKRDREALGL